MITRVCMGCRRERAPSDFMGQSVLDRQNNFDLCGECRSKIAPCSACDELSRHHMVESSNRHGPPPPKCERCLVAEAGDEEGGVAIYSHGPSDEEEYLNCGFCSWDGAGNYYVSRTIDAYLCEVCFATVPCSLLSAGTASNNCRVMSNQTNVVLRRLGEIESQLSTVRDQS